MFLEMGFSEIEGDYVQSAGWNMDALFIPQSHPARTMQDTFYLDEVTFVICHFLSLFFMPVLNRLKILVLMRVYFGGSTSVKNNRSIISGVG